MARSKVKDWTTEIMECDDWNKLIDSDRLVVAEIYSAVFGFCEVYTPVIDKIMSAFKEEQQQNIEWTRLNVAQLEKENSHNPLELLGKWASYESPKPLYVFIQNKQILGTVTEANGGRMKDTVTACVNGEALPKEPTPEPVEEVASASESEPETEEKPETEADEEQPEEQETENVEDVEQTEETPAEEEVENKEE